MHEHLQQLWLHAATATAVPLHVAQGTSRFVRDSVDSVVGMTVVTADESGSARVRKYTAQDPDWDAVR